MKKEIELLSAFAENEEEKRAAELFCAELKSRTGGKPVYADCAEKAGFVFKTDGRENRDEFSIDYDGTRFVFSAAGVRGLVFAYGRFLRKTEYADGNVYLVEDIDGDYCPDKKIRGHQLGYRTTPNTYDAWDYDDYFRYYLDIMYMGCNTVEHIPYEGMESRRNRLMKYDEQEFLVKATEMADELDLDVSLWYPNQEEESHEQAAERRRKLLETLPRADILFPPGGDPGEMPADEFIDHCIAIKKAAETVFPEIEMWPSAQAPHSIPNWGDTLVESLKSEPEEINGIIYGPNHAFDLDTLRRKVPGKYPIRFYPDITHNVRCEYPVHFDRDDWHFALTTGLGRECTNPRPMEYRRIHRITSPYVCGSVSYSEGITDDVNKFIWSDMDFDPEVTIRDSLLDYARLFFPGAPADKLADGILRLELDWACDPGENPGIDSTLELFESLRAEYPSLDGNWRFDQLIFRAECDWVLRYRRIFEHKLVKRAKAAMKKGDLEGAKKALEGEYCEKYAEVRADITALAQHLFDEIGLQTDIEHYCADNWERGAVLEIIDLPVTDRAWLLNRLAFADTLPEDERADFAARVAEREKVKKDEFHFSIAVNGLAEAGAPQQGEVYMNFQGDRPFVNNGTMPTAMFGIFDNLSFRLKTGGLTAGTDYILRVAFSDESDERITDHRVIVNGHTVYEGKQFGGVRNEKFEKEMLAPRFKAIEYTIPAEYIENGCIDLLMQEDYMGIMFSELWIVKA